MLYLQFLIDALLLSGIYALMSLGLSLSLGVTRILNFTHGEAVMLAAYGAFWPFFLYAIDPLIALPFIIVIAFVSGALLFRYFLQDMIRAPHFNQILLTFGIALVLQNIAVILWRGDLRSATPDYALQAIDLDLVFIPVGRLIGFVLALILSGLLLVWLRYSFTGRAVRALAENRDAAALMGIDVLKTYRISFGISTALAAASGVILSTIAPISPFLGLSALIKSIEIIVLGGIGSLGGTILGALVLGIAETAVAYFVPDGSGWASGVGFGLLFMILILRPRGLRGQAVEI
ncbi:branched-chain amino acid ABC transporter permease [Bradyrhizobium sp. 31Argb]|uniref:branched-chain amino acid ABC transporter permease n=1 Tax=Bradyrhizobium sp. 31Argb TaxID=3141247 RepID=UPI0037485800